MTVVAAAVVVVAMVVAIAVVLIARRARRAKKRGTLRPSIRAWGWEGSEEAGTGAAPFPSREAALLNATAVCGEGETVWIGIVEYVDPAQYVGWVVDEMSAEMEAAAEHDYEHRNGEMFVMGSGAYSALRSVVRTWARDHVVGSAWNLIETEEVEL